MDVTELCSFEEITAFDFVELYYFFNYAFLTKQESMSTIGYSPKWISLVDSIL